MLLQCLSQCLESRFIQSSWCEQALQQVVGPGADATKENRGLLLLGNGVSLEEDLGP